MNPLPPRTGMHGLPPVSSGLNGGLPPRSVPVTDEPDDDEVDVPPFMRR